MVISKQQLVYLNKWEHEQLSVWMCPSGKLLCLCDKKTIETVHEGQ